MIQDESGDRQFENDGKNVLCLRMYFGNAKGEEKLKIRNYLKILQ